MDELDQLDNIHHTSNSIPKILTMTNNYSEF